MCFGGGNKSPDIPAPPPPPPPAPIPIAPSEVSSPQTTEQRANTVKQLQYGILSTIKTGGTGITGVGPDLITASAGGPGSGRRTLGGA